MLTLAAAGAADAGDAAGAESFGAAGGVAAAYSFVEPTARRGSARND